MSNKLDNLVGNHPGNRSQDENIDPNFPLEVEIDNSFDNQIPLLQTANPRGCDMATGVSGHQPQQNVRSSSLPPPGQKYSDDFVNTLLETLKTATQTSNGIPRLPKALSTTMPTFDGRNDKFEHFEDLFNTTSKSFLTKQKKRNVTIFTL